MNTNYSLDQIKNWCLQEPSAIIQELKFEGTVRLACAMLTNDQWEEEPQVFAVRLLEVLRSKYSDRWNASWRFDALLGFAYDIVMDYDERFNALKRALDKADSAPSELLIAYARCYRAPGTPPITREEAVSIIKEAMKDKIYVEGVILLQGLYYSLGNSDEQLYWSNILNTIKDIGPHLPRLDNISNLI